MRISKSFLKCAITSMLAMTLCVSTASVTCKAAPVGTVTGSVSNRTATGKYKYEKGHQLRVQLYVVKKNSSTGHVDDVTTTRVVNGDYASVSETYTVSSKYGILSNKVSGFLGNQFQRSITYHTS